MRWKGRSRSTNVEDRRGMSPRVMASGGGLGLILIVGLVLLLGDPKDLQQILGQVQQQQQQPAGGGSGGKDDEAAEFIGVVLHDTEVVWNDLFRQHVGKRYRNPKLIIFDGQVQSACGVASSAVGPFYCPADQQIYIDPSFFYELRQRHNAPGDFAQAYVIAHEVAHHVQKLVGYSDIVARERQKGERAGNRASVRLELQADYLAGVWAHHAQKRLNILESGDIEEAINAANQIGDDTLMKRAGGYVRPERFTHGTSAQRAYWFKQGLKTGDFAACESLFELKYDEL